MQINELRNQINDLRMKIEEESKNYPSDALIEKIDHDRREMEEMIKKIKDLTEEPSMNAPQFDQFIAEQEDTIQQIDDKIKLLEEEKEKVKKEMEKEAQNNDQAAVDRNKGYLELLQ